MSHMFLSILYPLKNIEILAYISENGNIFWSANDICKAINYTHVSRFLKRYLGKDENITRISDIYTYTRSTQYVLKYEQVLKILFSIPRESKTFLEFFENLNNGVQKIYYNNEPTTTTFTTITIRDKRSLFNIFTTKKDCLHFKTFSENGVFEIETTIPEILRYKIWNLREKFYEQNNASTSTSNNMEDYYKSDNVENLSFQKEEEEEEIGINDCSRHSDNKSDATESMFNHHQNLIDNSKNFIYKDVRSGETYEYLALDLNWKNNDMRPINIYPAIRFEEDRAFLFVPIKKNL